MNYRKEYAEKRNSSKSNKSVKVNNLIEVDGVIKSFRDHCDYYNIKLATALKRVERGMSPAQAITCPVGSASFFSSDPCVYLIENKENGKKYVGISTDPKHRWKSHKQNYKRKKDNKKPLYKDMAVFGVNSFQFSILEKCSSIQDAQIKEKHWIKKLNSMSPDGYNVKSGGEYTRPMNDVVIDGKNFPSINAACRFYKISKDVVRHRLNIGMTFDEIFVEKKEIQIKHKNAFIFDGAYYSSLADACKKNDVVYATAIQRIKRGYTIEQAISKSRLKKSEPNLGKKVSYNGVEYRSMSHLAREYGISPDFLDSRLRHGFSLDEALKVKKWDRRKKIANALTENYANF